MTNKNKALGTGLENRAVEKAQKKGLPAKKQPGSGVFKGYPSDVVLAERVLGECKVRSVEVTSRGAKVAPFEYGWVDKVIEEAKSTGFDFGVVIFQPKAVRKQYAVMEFETFLDILVQLYGIPELSTSPESTDSNVEKTLEED
jgi:hypothetical protein